MSFEEKIGFDLIRRQVEQLCTTSAARERVRAEDFCFFAPELERRLGLADEMRTVLVTESGFPAGEFVDTAQIISKARVEGAFLEVAEIHTLHLALSSVDEILKFLRVRNYSFLKTLSEGIDSYPEIVRQIETLIDHHGEVKDSASSELADIRRAIRRHEGEAAKRMNRILSQAISTGVVEADTTLSIRDGHAVIPVAAANKKKLPGFVRDESGSGRTFYIEPVEVVELSNALRELEYAERREIVRILTEFTDNLRPDLDGVARAGEFLIEVDFIRAKARWAVCGGAVKPIVSHDGRLVLRSARHPLLAQTLARDKKELVPLDVELSKTDRILVISGPNAGGKSVCLKTIALLQYMFQCGFLVPAGENSELPVFRSLMIDIGDEQSIENDLSTYSSHLQNMKQMVREADENAMVFIDEFGSGTEPVIGGAIAEAVLEKLVEKCAYGVVTTHYANIKYFASNHAGVANGAMAFDVHNIAPLFRLVQGEPGSSFAIEIARKIGLPEEIISAASSLAGSDYMRLEGQLRATARDRRYWERKRDKIRLAERRIEQMEAEYTEKLAAAKAEKKEILKAAKIEAGALVREANRQIENTIRAIKETRADKDVTRTERKKLEKFVDENAPLEKIPHFEIGSKVARKGAVVSGEITQKKLNFSSRLDVRGMRAHEALEAVEGFIDNALMVGVGEVSILHGKGTGALKTEIRAYLRTTPAVATAVDDHPDRGGAGITVVNFR